MRSEQETEKYNVLKGDDALIDATYRTAHIDCSLQANLSQTMYIIDR